MRVRLKTDLTKYHPSLSEGIEGEAIGTFGKHSQVSPRAFVGVRFPEHTLDVLWKDLERLMTKRAPPKDGPQLTIQSLRPPKRGQVVEFAGMQFQVESLAERAGEDLWVVNLSALP